MGLLAFPVFPGTAALYLGKNLGIIIGIGKSGFFSSCADGFPLQRSSRLLSMRYFNTAEADLIEIIIVRLGGENQDQKGLVDFLYGLFSGNREKVLSYIPDSDKPVRQKEVADMLSMISYAEENGIKKGEKRGEKRGEKKGENRLGTLMNILLKNKRYSDAEKASEDEEYREELYKEYKL